MSLEKFNNSTPFTIGIELEVRLIDSEDYSIKNSANTVFENLPDRIKPHIHKELLQSMIEIVTPVFKSATKASEFIRDTALDVSKIGLKHGFLLSALATHPFEKMSENEIIKDDRYEKILKEFQIVIRNFLISGLHIHVGMRNQDEAVKVYNSIINYSPIFLALSANSPLFSGEDTGLYSYRTKIFEQLPRAGVGEYFDSYEDFELFYEQLYSSGTIESFKDIWWDVRIHPKFGTIELRVCDSFFDNERLKYLAIFYQSLVAYSTIIQPKREFLQIIRQNKWNATRYGLNGKFIEQNSVMSIRKKALELVDKIEQKGIFKELNYQDAVENLRDLIKQPCLAHKQIELYKKTKDFKKVIELGMIKL